MPYAEFRIAKMAGTKQSGVLASRQHPARELAARATSKHGNPADYAIVCTADVQSAADIVASRVYLEAFRLEDRSHRGDISMLVGPSGSSRATVVIDVAPNRESILDSGGFSFAFAPKNARAGGPRFEGQIRVDHIDAANSRLVAEGRYVGKASSSASAGSERHRGEAEDVLRQIVSLLTDGIETA